ncbi:MAG: hypothetical protein DYG88_03005 [Chloroflexi bacterium CFX4]|nr:hypothetical protein [Chloroflexi bacterium CFX4]MDL1922622.1 YfhO family protein [Chloroflexi bacterium CFX3]
MAAARTVAWRYGLPLLIYVAAVCCITYPLITDLGGWLAGASYGDAFEYARSGWWAAYALQNGANPFYQSLFAYPEGFFSAAQWSQPLTYLPTTFLNFLFTPAAAYNLWLLCVLVLNGMAMHSLCRWLLRDHLPLVRQAAALIGGLIFTAYPTLQGNISIGMINPPSLYPLPILILCVLRLLEGERARHLILSGGVALWLLMLANFTAVLYSLLPLALIGGAYFLLRERYALRRYTLLALVGIVLIGGALCLPFYVPLAVEILTEQNPTVLFDGGSLHFSTDLLALIAPSPFTTWSFAPAFSRAAIGTNSMEGTAYLGVITLALSAVALFSRQRRAALWLLIALGCIILSLGALLKVNGALATVTISGVQSYIPLPYALLQDLPFVRTARTPGRFNATTGLALSVLAAYGAAWLFSRLPRRQVGVPLAVGVLSALILFDYQLFFPFMRHQAALPSYLSALAAREDVRAVLDVPYDDYVAQKIALWHQVTHHKPLIGGHVWRRPPIPLEKFGLLSDAALGKAFDLVSGDPLSAAAVHALLRAHGADVIIYHLLPINDPEAVQIGERLFGAPRHVDEHLAIFEVPQADPRALESVIPATYGKGWWRAARTWLTESADLYFYAPTEQAVRFSIMLEALPRMGLLRAALNGNLRASGDPQRLPLWHLGESGFHKLSLSAECVRVPPCLLPDEPCAAETPHTPLCISAALTRLRAEYETLWQAADVQLGSGMRLRGFRLPSALASGTPFEIITAWQASERLDGDYHLFVHILDQAGKLVAQDDFVPSRGAFPTTDWAIGQQWAEAAHLNGLPEGVYRAFVGWYRYVDGVRLSVQGEGLGAQDGLVYLGEITVRAP